MAMVQYNLNVPPVAHPPAGGGRAAPNMFSVYVVFNGMSRKFYIGQTIDLAKRLDEHNSRKFSSYTSRFDGEWTLLYVEHLDTRSEALRREKELKSYQGRQFIKRIVQTKE